jgi:hypothetical protein
MQAVDFTPVATLCVVVFCFQLATLLYVGAIWGRPGPGPVSEHEIGRLLAGKYSIEILDDHFSWDVAGGPGQTFGAGSAGRDELGRYYPILLEELTRYPVGLIQAIGLKRIVLCSRLTVNGNEKGGLTIVDDGTIFLNVSLARPVSDGFSRHAIHHEIAHVIDAALGPRRDGSWARLNPVDFAYGGDEILSALEVTGERPGARPETQGFLNYYSMVDAGEDRAEFFAHMMTSRDVLMMVAAGDPIVARKCLALRSDLIRFHRDFADILRDVSPAGRR